MIDCGEGTQMQLRRYRVRLGKIHHIFISHLHGDHIFGLFGLISTFSLLGRAEPLHIYGPEPLEDMLLDHMKYFQNDLGYKINFHRIQCRRSSLLFDDRNIEVHSIPLVHRVPSCGYLFREKPAERNIIKDKIREYQIPVRDIVRIKKGEGFELDDGTVVPNEELTIPPRATRSYAYCSDTRPSEAILPLIRDVDLLYHESTFLEEDTKLAYETFHSTASQAADLARRAGARKLILGHFSSRYKDVSRFEEEARQVFKDSYIANDGDVFEVD